MMNEATPATWTGRFASLSDLEIARIIDRVALMPYAYPREEHEALRAIVTARNIDVHAVLRAHERRAAGC